VAVRTFVRNIIHVRRKALEKKLLKILKRKWDDNIKMDLREMVYVVMDRSLE
jgi:hypothetical protein